MAIQDDTQGVTGIKDTIEGIVGQRVYPSEFFTLGLSNTIHEEERSILEAMCGLSAFECCHHQEKRIHLPASTSCLIS
jgi:hypothetical protein